MTHTAAPSVASIIAELRGNMERNEQAIARVYGGFFVIMWNGSVLRTNGQRIAICGPEVFSKTNRSAAQYWANKFADSLSAETREAEPVTVVTAAEALEIVRAENARLLAVVESANS
jgi:hypothetical protein